MANPFIAEPGWFVIAIARFPFCERGWGHMVLISGAAVEDVLRRAVTIADARADRPTILAAILLLILVAMAYPFFWTGNEDHYFVLARQWFDPEFRRPFDAAFDASSGKFVGLFLFGGAVELFGWNGGRLLIGFAAALSLAWGFASLARALGLSLIDTMIVMLLFLAAGQTVIGEEWFIGGIETKTFAYGLGMAGLAAALSGRTLGAAIWIVIALYFHFLVGAFWGGCIVIAALADGRVRDAIITAATIAALSMPLLYTLIADQLRAAAVAAPPDTPSANFIYSIIRNPHHVAPFANAGWQRGVLTALVWAGALGTMCRLIALRGDGAQKALGTTVAMLCLFVPLSLFLSWLDRGTGALGKFYLLRPFSPILLLGLFVLVSAWRKATEGAIEARFLPALLTIGFVVMAIGSGSYRAVVFRPPETQAHLIAALQRHVPPEALVLLDPATDALTGIPRLSGRQTIVSWKFVPTDAGDIYRWWRLSKLRDRIFAGSCPDAGSPIRFILASDASSWRVARCGREVWQGDGYRLIAVEPRA